METIGTTVRSAFNVGFILKIFIAVILIMLVAGILGMSSWLVDPWSNLKAKFPSLANIGGGGA